MGTFEVFDGTGWNALGGGTVSSVTITGSEGLTVTGSPITQNGTINLSLTMALRAFSALATNGILVKTAPDVYESRLLAVIDGLTISNANGVDGNPTIGLGTIPANKISGYPSDATKHLDGSGQWVNTDKPTTLTGAVTGTGTGTIATSLNYNFTQSLDMGGFKVTSLANPVTSTDALPLGYADNRYTTPADVTTSLSGYATESYVTTRGYTTTSTSLSSFAVPTGSVNINSNYMYNINTPTSTSSAYNSYAANKSYVDNLVKKLSYYKLLSLSGSNSNYIGNGDHCPLNNTWSSNDPSSLMSLSTSTYTTTVGSHGLGRVKLKAGYIYKIKGFMTSTGTVSYYGFSLYDVTSTATRFGTYAGGSASANADANADSMMSVGYIQASSDRIIELRKTGGTIIKWYSGNYNLSGCWLDIQVIGEI